MPNFSDEDLEHLRRLSIDDPQYVEREEQHDTRVSLERAIVRAAMAGKWMKGEQTELKGACAALFDFDRPKPKQTGVQRTEQGRVIAKYSGTCRECSERIHKGEAIMPRAMGLGWRHVDCPEVDHDDDYEMWASGLIGDGQDQ